MLTTNYVLEEIAIERLRQDKLWGDEHDSNHTDAEWLAIVVKQLGQIAQTGLNGGNMRKEVIQCAAVLVSWARRYNAVT